jgi:hypothetical protein
VKRILFQDQIREAPIGAKDQSTLRISRYASGRIHLSYLDLIGLIDV